MDKYSVLKQYFGHGAFRPGQEQLVDGVLAGRDVLGVMPTGGGKSLCYQVPALLLPGMALVVSPLISLMQDQVAALRGAGVAAAFLNSSLTSEQFIDTCREIRRGAYRLIYVAPERLENEYFASMAQGLEISLVAVDEAHCVSQWGQDFRPSYLKIAEFIGKLPKRPPVAAFTATATARVREDIAQLLGLRDPVSVVTGFDRANLFFEVRRPKQKLPAVSALVQERQGKSGIIYCATRAKVEQVCAALIEEGVSATRYHAGLSEEERTGNQNDFQFDRCPVMVATNAFGMGIDKSNVSFVIHYNMPKNLESYYQEAGRAGRDGEAAECILLYSAGDVVTAKMLLERSNEREKGFDTLEQDLRLLDAMVGYCKTTNCLRGYLLDYFGQGHGERCENCGNCRSLYVELNITRQAQMILSCIKRVKDLLGYYVGPALIIQVLRGSKNQRIRELGLERLSTYGILPEAREKVQSYIECLEAGGYVYVEKEHSTLRPTREAGQVLFHGQEVMMMARAQCEVPSAPPTRERKRLETSVQVLDGEQSGLLDRLKAARNKLAQEENVPAYIVFSNATLADMAAKSPRSLEAFLEVSGVGRVKASKYGKYFLDVIEEYYGDRGR